MSASRSAGVASNYADTLLTLAQAAGDTAGWGVLLRQLADAISSDHTLRLFLQSPRIASGLKSEVLTKAMTDKVPAVFLRYLQALVHNRRQMLIPNIADAYDMLLDASNGIVQARVTVARDLNDADRLLLAGRLSAVVGRTVVPHVTVDADILGGVIVRVGDTVMDGSLRRRLGLLRRRMMARPIA